MAESFLKKIKSGLKKLQDDAEARKDFKIKLACYEESYAESKSRKPELPDLESMADLKKQDPHAYADKLDSLAHMRSSIDAAYAAAKKIPDFDASNSDAGRVYGDAYVTVGTAVHDDWCVSNNQKYNDPKRADRQWQFLSSEAIGYDEFVKDLKYVDIVMTKKGFPSYMTDSTIGQNEASKSAKELVKYSFDVRQEMYNNMPSDDRRNFEIDRWSSLTKEKAHRSELYTPNGQHPSDAYYLAIELPKSADVQKDSNHHMCIDDFYEYTDDKYFVGKPFEVSGFDGMYTHVFDCDAVDVAMKQAKDRLTPDRVKVAEASLGVEATSGLEKEGPSVV